jgi:hypothetical protein
MRGNLRRIGAKHTQRDEYSRSDMGNGRLHDYAGFRASEDFLVKSQFVLSPLIFQGFGGIAVNLFT